MNSPQGSSLGIATTTVIAFVWDSVLYLERMNVLSQEGAGVVCEARVPVGSIMNAVFRFSTGPLPVRCKAEVLGHIATTPEALRVRHTQGDAAFALATQELYRDEAVTRIFRLEQGQPSPPPQPLSPAVSGAAPTPRLPQKPPAGLTLRFVELDTGAARLIARHLRIARDLGEQLRQREESLESDLFAKAQQEPGVDAFFHEGDLSKRALDW